jgi:multiple sugar transport system permease protein
MRNMASPWLSGSLWILALAALPAVFFIGILLYFTGWAFALPFVVIFLVFMIAIVIVIRITVFI